MFCILPRQVVPHHTGAGIASRIVPEAKLVMQAVVRFTILPHEETNSADRQSLVVEEVKQSGTHRCVVEHDVCIGHGVASP